MSGRSLSTLPWEAISNGEANSLWYLVRNSVKSYGRKKGENIETDETLAQISLLKTVCWMKKLKQRSQEARDPHEQNHHHRINERGGTAMLPPTPKRRHSDAVVAVSVTGMIAAGS